MTKPYLKHVLHRQNGVVKIETQHCLFFHLGFTANQDYTTYLEHSQRVGQKMGYLVYKFKKIMGRTDFSDQFKEITICHKHTGYNLNVMRQSACLVINQIRVDNFPALFNCTLVNWASGSMIAPT